MNVPSLIAWLFLILACMPTQALAAEYHPGFVLSDHDLINKDSMNLNTIQQFLLSKGTLGTFQTADVDGVVRSASEIIHRVAQSYLISPRFILTMLQKEQSLVEDPTPSQRQFDWATGYAVCDGCYLNASEVSRFRGFAKQIDSMAQQFRFGYLEDLRVNGETQTRIAPGREVLIDGEPVTPENNATAAMYTYTPHLHGNANFAKIWDRWFSYPDYPSGSLLKNGEDQRVWLIQFGKRREIKSASVLQSFYDPTQVIVVAPQVLADYDVGNPIVYPNYALVRSESGDVYLIVGDTKRHFVSSDDLARFGYSPEEVLSGTEAELAGYQEGPQIDFATAYPQGVVLQHPDTKTLFYVDGGKRHIIASEAIRQARFASWRIRASTVAELSMYAEGAPITLPEGTLVIAEGSPTVYVISDSRRRPIADEASFLELGYQWDRIRHVDMDTLGIHPLGAVVATQ